MNKEFSKIYLIMFFVFYFLFFLNPLYAQKIVFGFTNVSKALMLHPLMAKFNVNEGRFLPEALGKNEKKDAKERSEYIKNKRQILLKERKRLEKKLKKLDKSYDKHLAELNKLRQNLSSGALNKYNKKRSQLENKFWKERKELQQLLNSNRQELARLNKENSLLTLTSLQETEQVFKLMLDDIYEAIGVVAKHYKIDFVMNSSFTVERTPVNPSFKPINPMGTFLKSKFHRDAKEVLYKHGDDGSAPLVMTLSYWCACQRWAFRNCMDSRLDKMIIKGGMDMTPAVVDYIYQKYNVPASHRDIIRLFLESENK